MASKKDAGLHVDDAKTYMEDTMARLGLSPELFDRFATIATRYYQSHVKLVSVKNLSEAQLADIILESPVGQMRGLHGQTYVGFICDPKLSGETVTAPHIRTPTLNLEQMQLLVGAATKARGSTGHVLAGDLYFIPDAGKHGSR